ncbi:MAG: hypothetical protein M0R80_08490 [Proteobacteria bacterium]|jgi:endo-alpha-1,4-polygalactosaminidase (GH114 family)|nr:hypothetical protein [Pseudomonadota bacterium]
MKNNTDESKALLERALKELPNDFALQNARYHLKRTLNEIEQVEDKRHKREKSRITIEEDYRAKMNSFFITPDNAKAVLDGIDSMISEEQKKIDNMKKKAEKQTPTLITDID